jgi:hypothetical protein
MCPGDVRKRKRGMKIFGRALLIESKNLTESLLSHFDTIFIDLYVRSGKWMVTNDSVRGGPKKKETMTDLFEATRPQGS